MRYLAMFNGGYLCTNSSRALIASWLKASQRSRHGVESDLRSSKVYKVLVSPKDWILR